MSADLQPGGSVCLNPTGSTVPCLGILREVPVSDSYGKYACNSLKLTCSYVPHSYCTAAIC